MKEFLCGYNSVIAAMTAGRRRLRRLVLMEAGGAAQRLPVLRTERLRALAAKINLPVDEADKGELNSLTNNATHQGCVLEADPLSPVDLRWLGAVSRHVAAAAQGGQEDGDQTLLTFDAEGMTETSTIRRPATPSMPLWLALDQVVDPQNFGAILRSAYFFGVDGVAVCERNRAPLSPAASRASGGAMELMTVHSVDSLANFLTDSGSRGWKVAGTSAPGSLRATPSHAFDYSAAPTILVLGNEGAGLRPHIARLCSAFLTIEAAASNEGSLIDSLNVSAATAVLCSQWRTSSSSSTKAKNN